MNHNKTEHQRRDKEFTMKCIIGLIITVSLVHLPLMAVEQSAISPKDPTADKAEDRSDWMPLDGSFEGKILGRMLGPWYLPTKAEEKPCISIDSTTYQDGCQSICITNPDAKPDDRPGIGQGLPSLKPDTKYLLTFWVKGENIKKLTEKSSGALVNIIWPGRKYNEFWPVGGYSGTFEWTKQAIEFKTPPDPNKDGEKATAFLNLRLQFASGKVWFDNVRILEISDKGEIK